MDSTTRIPPAIEAAPLTGVAAIRHGFFTREGGVSEGLYASLNCGFGSSDDEAAVAENRRRAAAALGIGGPALITAYQVHGIDVVPVDHPWAREQAPKADGMVTATPGIALGILTADCAPVLFADGEARVIGACHAGWRGALDGVIAATVAAMESLGAARGRIRAGIGPTIAQDSYQVGPEFRDRFVAVDSANGRFFVGDADDRFRFDLPGYVESLLAEAGIGEWARCGHDTCSLGTLLFSYRRATLAGDADFGRALSAIALTDVG